MRLLIGIVLLASLASATGCRMCCAPDDPNYAAYGGAWERHDQQYGRVGSLYAPGGSPVMGDYYVEGSAETGPTPTPADPREGEEAPIEDDLIEDDVMMLEEGAVMMDREEALSYFGEGQ